MQRAAGPAMAQSSLVQHWSPTCMGSHPMASGTSRVQSRTPLGATSTQAPSGQSAFSSQSHPGPAPVPDELDVATVALVDVLVAGAPPPAATVDDALDAPPAPPSPPVTVETSPPHAASTTQTTAYTRHAAGSSEHASGVARGGCACTSMREDRSLAIADEVRTARLGRSRRPQPTGQARAGAAARSVDRPDEAR